MRASRVKVQKFSIFLFERVKERKKEVKKKKKTRREKAGKIVSRDAGVYILLLAVAVALESPITVLVISALC